MKIGIISDIHNNVVALTEVLKTLKIKGCEKIICCGDIIGIGPYPEQTVQLLINTPELIAVKGNHDKYFVEGLPSEVPNIEGMGLGEMDHHKWEHKLLTEKSCAWLKSLPSIREIKVENVKIAIMHYAIDRSNNYMHCITQPNIQECYNMFSNIESDIVVFGHNHTQNIIEDNKKLFINCGSLGCPSKNRNIAKAVILNIEDNVWAVEQLNITYDATKVVSDIEQMNYPESSMIRKIFFGVK